MPCPRAGQRTGARAGHDRGQHAGRGKDAPRKPMQGLSCNARRAHGHIRRRQPWWRNCTKPHGATTGDK
eukprot:11187211-Lingulodinium_polyedra.AAC.1